MGNVQQRLDELGIELPPAGEPKGLYRPVTIAGDLALTAGHLPVRPDGSIVTGRLGDDLDVAAGCEAARLAGLAILASLRLATGDLDRVERLVKLVGLVSSTADFDQQPAVINGCSELLREVFGPEAGVAARSAIGAAALPLGAAVEIEAIFQLHKTTTKPD